MVTMQETTFALTKTLEFNLCGYINRASQTLHTEYHSNWCHGQRILEESISMMNLLDEKSLDKIAESTEIRLWKSFIIFGSGVLAVLIIVWLIKLASIIIDTIIHGYALHLSIVAAFIFYPLYWSSVIHLLLHLGKGNQGEDQNEQQSETLSMTEEPHKA